MRGAAPESLAHVFAHEAARLHTTPAQHLCRCALQVASEMHDALKVHSLDLAAAWHASPTRQFKPCKQDQGSEQNASRQVIASNEQGSRTRHTSMQRTANRPSPDMLLRPRRVRGACSCATAASSVSLIRIFFAQGMLPNTQHML